MFRILISAQMSTKPRITSMVAWKPGLELKLGNCTRPIYISFIVLRVRATSHVSQVKQEISTHVL